MRSLKSVISSALSPFISAPYNKVVAEAQHSAGGEATEQLLVAIGPGVEIHPLSGARLVVPSSDPMAVGGYYNDEDVDLEEGEIKIFSKSALGGREAQIHLLSSGDIEISLSGDSSELRVIRDGEDLSDFGVSFNDLKSGFDGLTSDFNNFVTLFNSHIHPTPNGPSQAPAAPGESSSASIDDSKAEKVRL